MKHKQTDKCGIKNGICSGIPDIERIVLCCLSDLTPQSRQNDANFLNIPNGLTGAVRNTAYNLLLALLAPFIYTCADVTPFTLLGFVDLLSQLTKLPKYVSWGNSTDCYYNGSEQYPSAPNIIYLPGILTPIQNPSDFNQVPVISVPVTILATSAGSSGGTGSDIDAMALAMSINESNNTKKCDKCGITAYFDNGTSMSKKSGTSKPKYTVAASSCTIIIGSKNKITVSGSSKDNISLDLILVFIIAKYDYSSTDWDCLYVFGSTDDAISKLSNGDLLFSVGSVSRALAGTKKGNKSAYYWTLTTNQEQCGPLLPNDWVALLGMPSETLDVLVFYAKPNSNKKGWLALKLCK